MLQAHIFYSGTVQGVGFRYTTVGYAQELKLTGWVRNLPDGRVEILAQGDKTSIEVLCQRLDHHFDGYIKDKTIDYVEPQDPLKNFQVTH